MRDIPRRSSSLTPQAKPLFLLLAVGFLCVTGVSAVRELYRQNEVKTELHTLETRVAQLNERKTTVSTLLQQLQTSEAIDREARLRLNMQKPGERVYVLRGDEWERVAKATQVTDSPALYTDAPVEVTRSNPQRWFRLFFIHDQNAG